MSTQSATAQINGQSLLPPSIESWKLFLADQGNSIHTVKAFSADMHLLASYLPPDQTLGKITTNDLNNFLEWMETGRGVPCSPKTLARRITSIKAFFRWLQSYGSILVDPAEKVVQKSVISPLPPVLSQTDLHIALETANYHRLQEKPDARPYALFKLLIDTGIKKGECLNLTTNHIDFDAPNGPIIFIRYESPKYRYKERKLRITDDWIEAYQEYKNQYDLSEKLFPWSPRRLEYLLEDIGKQAGIENQLSFLMCRWSSALTDLFHGIDPNKIRQKLGVSKIQWREVHMKLRKLAGPEYQIPKAD